MSIEPRDVKKESDPSDNSSFIRETVEPPRKSRKRNLLLRLLVLLFAAVIFGLVAALTMVLAEPWMDERFGEKESEAIQIVIPRDSVETDPTVKETETADQVPDEEQIRDMIESGIKSYMESFDASDLEGSDEITSARKVAEESMKGCIVTVSSRHTGEDVFQNSYTRSEQTFGLIVAKTSNELLVLTEDHLVENAGVFVSYGGDTVDALLKASDPSFGMAMVSVSRADLSAEVWEELNPAPLGNSYMVRKGDVVVAMGAPLAYSGSISQGIIAYVNTLQSGKDMNFQVLQTDIAADPSASGILVNSDGQVVGWVTQAYNPEGMENVLAAVSFSDIKGLIQNMTNGRRSGYLGIRFRTVTSQIAEEQQMPQGIYVTKCIKDSPAYNVGIRNGDVITAISGNTIYNETDFERIMEGLVAEDAIAVTVMRQGRDGYTEMKYEVILGSR